MEELQFIGNLMPSLAPALLISFVCIRVILEFLKERRTQQEEFRLERKEWREDYEKLVRDAHAARAEDIANYRSLLADSVALGRDLVNQMHALKGEITKVWLQEGRKKLSGNE